MHTLSCSEDTAQESLHLHTRVFSHRVGEILWFTELRTRAQDQQRTGTSGHSADFICFYTFERFGLAPSSCCCLSGQTLYPAKHQQGFVIYPYQCKVRTWSLKLYVGKSIFLLKQHMCLENKHKEESLPIHTGMEDRFLDACRRRNNVCRSQDFSTALSYLVNKIHLMSFPQENNKKKEK